MAAAEEPSWRRNFLAPYKRFQDRISIDIPDEDGKNFRIECCQRLEPTPNCVWDASVVLAGYLMVKSTFHDGFWNNKRVCELGAGCGVTGIMAALLGADVTLTELGEEMDVVNQNIDINFPLEKSDEWRDKVRTRPVGKELFWGDDASHLSPPFDFILGADVVYEVQHFDLLVRALQDVTGPQTKIILGIEHRWSDIESWFWNDVHKAGFKSKPIPRENHHHIYQHPKIDIYEVWRK